MSAWRIVRPSHNIKNLDIRAFHPFRYGMLTGIVTEHRDRFKGAAEVEIDGEVDMIRAGYSPYTVARLSKVLCSKLQELLMILLSSMQLSLITPPKIISFNALQSENVGERP
jgi:hypothetical protein